MWDKVFMFIVLCAITFFISKLTQTEPNKYKFGFKFFLFYFYSSAIAFLIWPFFLLNPRSVHNARIGAWILKHISKVYHLQWILRDGNILSEDRGAVIVSNHQSSLDILGLFNVWEVAHKMTAVSKKELLYVWPFGPVAYLAGVVFIDRSHSKNAYKQLDITSEVMVNKRTKIWLFPEGTRNKDYRQFLPFKKGAFNIAVAAQVPIIPVVFSPYYFINRKKYIFDKGHVIIQCLKPISTKGLTSKDVPDLMSRVRDKMTAAYKELTKEVVDSLPAGYPFTTDG